MTLRVHVTAGDMFALEGMGIGDRLSGWLTFVEAGRWPMPETSLQVVRGHATSLPSWPGAELGRYSTRIDVEGAALYWDRPEHDDGKLSVEGLIWLNTIDAPEGFPDTVGRVQGIWLAASESGSSIEGTDYKSVDRLPAPDLRSFGRRWTGAILDIDCRARWKP